MWVLLSGELYCCVGFMLVVMNNELTPRCLLCVLTYVLGRSSVIGFLTLLLLTVQTRDDFLGLVEIPLHFLGIGVEADGRDIPCKNWVLRPRT